MGHEQAEALEREARVQRDARNYDEALRLLHEARRAWEALGDVGAVKRVYGLLTELEEARHRRRELRRLVLIVAAVVVVALALVLR